MAVSDHRPIADGLFKDQSPVDRCPLSTGAASVARHDGRRAPADVSGIRGARDRASLWSPLHGVHAARFPRQRRGPAGPVLVGGSGLSPDAASPDPKPRFTCLWPRRPRKVPQRLSWLSAEYQGEDDQESGQREGLPPQSPPQDTPPRGPAARDRPPGRPGAVVRVVTHVRQSPAPPVRRPWARTSIERTHRRGRPKWVCPFAICGSGGI